MRNRPTTMRKLTDSRILQNATVSVVLMELLLACAPNARTTTAEDSRPVTTQPGQMVEAVDYPDQPLPSCNVRDNRTKDPHGNDACTEVDNLQHTISIKVATRSEGGAEKGQTFFCQCGDTNFVTVEGPLDLPAGSRLDRLESIAITSHNPTCLVWSGTGANKKCDLWAPD